MFSDLQPRPSRTQPACAPNVLRNHKSTIRRRDNSAITSPRENSWGVAHGVETGSAIAFEKKTGETSESSWYIAEKMPWWYRARERTHGGTHFQRDLWKAGVCRRVSIRVASVRSNTGETCDSGSLQHQTNALMVPNPRENSRGGRISRETSGRLAYVGERSPQE